MVAKRQRDTNEIHPLESSSDSDVEYDSDGEPVEGYLHAVSSIGCPCGCVPYRYNHVVEVLIGDNQDGKYCLNKEGCKKCGRYTIGPTLYGMCGFCFDGTEIMVWLEKSGLLEKVVSHHSIQHMFSDYRKGLGNRATAEKLSNKDICIAHAHFFHPYKIFFNKNGTPNKAIMKTVEKARTLQGLVRILEKAHLVNELVAHPSLDQKFKQYVHAKKRNGATIAEDKRAIFYSSDANFDVYAIFFNKDGSKNKDTEKIVNRAKRIVQALRILKNGHSYRQFIEHPSMNEKYEQFIKTKAENDTPLDAKKTILSATDDIDADAVFENKTNIFKDGDFDIHGVFYDSSGNLNPAIWDLVNATRKKWMKNPYKKQKIAKD